MNVPAIRADAPPQSLTGLAASLASSQKVELEIRPTASMKTLEGGAIAWAQDGGTKVSVTVRAGADTAEALQSTLNILKSSLSKPSPHHVEDWLVELDAITAKRATDAADLALRLRAYRNRLCEFPAAAVRYTLLVERWKFWPTWDELGDSLDRQVAEVNRMIDAIEQKIALLNHRPAPLCPLVSRSEEQKNRANDIVSQLGFRPIKRFGGDAS